jgi:hypothetical protein
VTGSAEPLVRAEHLTKRYAGELRSSIRYALRDIGRELISRGSPAAARPG